jgi:hypothetical protein
MMTTFEQLEVGERFHLGVDADGQEPYMWKVSDTEAYTERGSGTGTRQTVDDTEVERAALTLLLGPQQQALNANHPGLNL